MAAIRMINRRVPQVAVLRDLCPSARRKTQVCEYADLWHPKLIAWVLTLGALSVSAQPTSQPVAGTASHPLDLTLDPPPNPNSVDQNLAEAKARPAGIFKYGPVSIMDPLLEQFNAAAANIGLKVGVAYTAAFQAASGGPGIRRVAGGDIDVFGDWRLLGEKDGKNNGYLYFYAEQRHTLGTDVPPGSLGGQIGSLWGTTNGFSEQPLALKELYWQQHFNGDRLILRIGKLDAENYYNSNYWQSDAKFFMNQAFSSFPVRAFPSNGLGINITAKLSDQFYISTGFQDAQGKKTTAGFDTFFQDFNLFSAFELGFTPTIEEWGRGVYRFTAWYRDHGEGDGKPHDAGFDISFDQHVGKHFVPFFRAGIGQGNINGIENMVSGGVGWEGKLLTESDVIGVGGAWGQPSDHHLRDQYSTEIFYRLQVSPDNQFTVGYQFIIDPAKDSRHDLVGVFEMRWRIAM
jgi:porin